MYDMGLGNPHRPRCEHLVNRINTQFFPSLSSAVCRCAPTPKSATTAWARIFARLLLPLRGPQGSAYGAQDTTVGVKWGQCMQTGLHIMWLQPR
jgi:hypothetical protein